MQAGSVGFRGRGQTRHHPFRIGSVTRTVTAAVTSNPHLSPLVAEEPRFGYDIGKEIEEWLGPLWPESYGHICPMLDPLPDVVLLVLRPCHESSPPCYDDGVGPPFA